MLVHTCNPSPQENRAGGVLAQGQSELHSETLSQKTVSIIYGKNTIQKQNVRPIILKLKTTYYFEHLLR
jgi:hypothetical protein